jgi:hypothetical protein
VVRCIEAIAGTELDIQAKQKTDGDLALQVLLLDDEETPIDLTAFTTVKGRTVSVKGFPLPATGRYFVVVRPALGFEGDVSLRVAVEAPRSPRGEVALDPAGSPVTVPFSVLEGSKVVIGVKAAKRSPAVPTITSLTDANGNELFVPEELKTSAAGATLKVKQRLAGGDYFVTFDTGGSAGDVKWTIAVKGPRKYVFEMTDVPVTGE